jgi:hypothetical protein
MESVRSSISKELIGVWQRESICIGDGQPYEDSRVLWLQTPYLYADMRLPLPGEKVGEESFAGDQLWADPSLTFNHELDFTGTSSQDIGLLSWDGETLVESGSASYKGDVIHYVERWHRCTPNDVASSAWEVRDSDKPLQAIALMVGNFAMLVTNFSMFGAQLFETDSSTWVKTAQVGVEVECHPPWIPEPLTNGIELDWRQIK